MSSQFTIEGMEEKVNRRTTLIWKLTFCAFRAKLRKDADVMELVDMQDLGSCASGVGVRVPSSAPKSLEARIKLQGIF